jgi:hypothetical protein
MLLSWKFPQMLSARAVSAPGQSFLSIVPWLVIRTQTSLVPPPVEQCAP